MSVGSFSDGEPLRWGVSKPQGGDPPEARVWVTIARARQEERAMFCTSRVDQETSSFRV